MESMTGYVKVLLTHLFRRAFFRHQFFMNLYKPSIWISHFLRKVVCVGRIDRHIPSSPEEELS